MRRSAASAGNPPAALAQRDHLKSARTADRPRIGAEIDQRSLAAEDRSRRHRYGRCPRDPRGAVDEDVLRCRIDHRGDVECRAERRIAGPAVVGFADRADIPQSEIGHRREDAGGHPGASRVDHGIVAAGRTAADLCDRAVFDDHVTALDRFAAVAGRDRGIGHREGLRGGGRRKGAGSGRKESGKAHHFTSPSPGWPSSKSLTGRRLRSIASNISAPSTQTFSGRE